MRCKRCGHEWASRTDHPIACPKCKRYDWDDDSDEEVMEEEEEKEVQDERKEVLQEVWYPFD